MARIKHIVLILFGFMFIQNTVAQQYTDQEIGFDPQRLTQRLLEKGIPQEEIGLFIRRERELHISMHQQMSLQMEVEEARIQNLSTIQQDQFTVNAASDCTIPILESEKQALITLYNTTDGPNWTNTWDIINTEPCQWYGVTVLEGKVTSLDLDFNGLQGPIPQELGGLPDLRILYLHGNALHGSIPSSLGNLTRLQQLNLSGNQLTGDIPIELGNIGNSLTYFGLSSNSLTGSIPVELFNLSSLQTLRLDYNNLSGGIPPQLGSLTELVSLRLDRNGLSGEIPVEFGNLAKLEFLILYSNQLSGQIPTSLGNLSLLNQIILFNNQLSGMIPVSLGNLNDLNYLGLQNNLLDGNIPDELGNLNSLRSLYLENNELTGSIPATFGDLSSLQNLHLGLNLLNGNIPSELGMLTNLESLNLAGNELNGSIPNEFVNLSNLEDLYLSTNRLSGSIPSSLSTIGTLIRLNFRTNMFVFSDFEDLHNIFLGGLSSYTYYPQANVDEAYPDTVPLDGTITLTSNVLTSPNNTYQWYKDGVVVDGATSKDYVITNATEADAGVYHFLANNTVVTGLTLERNPITLSVDTTDTCGVSGAEKQALIDLYNSTDGPNWSIPANFVWDFNEPVCNWLGVTVVDQQVTGLSLTNRNLNGSLPPSFGNLIHLQTLWLNDNQISGSLPSELGNLEGLTLMNLSKNNLTGGFPSGLGNLSELESLFLYDNNLTGTLPATIGNMTGLVTLNLGQNQFSGELPDEIGNLVNLTSLSLYLNQFTGSIPTTIGNLTSLGSIFAYGNGLSGSIPSQLSNLPLSTVYLYDNLLSGDIPDFTNTSLNNLRFDNNAFIFENFEQEHAGYFATFNLYQYSPQANVDEAYPDTVPLNGAITLTSNVLTSLNNTYQWYKDGVAIEGATAKDYVITNATEADAGVYHFLANNTVVTGLTLERNPITLTVDNANTCGVSDTEKQALLDLYNSTNGGNWTNTLAGDQPWDSNIPVCDWYGVVVANDHVVTLDLNTNALNGTLPSSLNVLTNLTNLSLYRNSLSGTIPTELGELTSLITINLSINNLSGNIPTSFGGLTNLQQLFLADNALEGPIPPDLGNLSNLVVLHLYSNELSDSIPATLGSLGNLTQLSLFDNQLEGSIPASLGNMTSLQTLQLFSNRLSGSVPNELTNLSNLNTLQIHQNQLGGDFPDFSYVDVLFMQNNAFVFSNFETEHAAYESNIDDYFYSPQADVDEIQTIYVTEGHSTILPNNVLRSPNNSYTWYKTNSSGGDIEIGSTSNVVGYTINNATPTDAGTYYFIAGNSIITGLTLRRNPVELVVLPDIVLNGDECDLLLENVADGSFEACTDEIQALGDIQPIACSGWELNLENQDRTMQPFVLDSPIDSDIDLNMNVVASPEGGVFSAAQVFLQDGGTYPNIEEGVLGFNTMINNLKVGTVYVIEFYETNGSDPSQMIGYGDTGGWSVRFGDQSQLSPGVMISQIPAWNKVTMTFRATSESQSLELNPYSRYEGGSFDSSIRNPRKVMLIDGLQVFEVGSSCINEEDCIDVLATTTDGSFESSTNASSRTRNGSLDATGWTVTEGTPDTFTLPFINGEDPYLRDTFSNSPDGGNCVGTLRAGSTSESFSTLVTGLNSGSTYVVEFYQANATNLLDNRMIDQTRGYWEVLFGTEAKTSATMNSAESTSWVRSRLEFTAYDIQETLEFRAESTALDALQSYPVYLLIDGIRVYEKPEDPYTTACYAIATQVFCNTSDDHPPTIGDLIAPQGGTISWYSDPVGGTLHYASDELADLGSFLWAEDGSGTRTALEVIFDLGAPEGLEYQTFDLNSSPTLANLTVEGTNITWHDSFSGATELPLTTILVDEGMYYAAQNGNACRLAVAVNIDIPELKGDGYQEFCSSNTPTIANLEMEPTNPTYTVVWYSASTGGTAYDPTDLLNNDTTYYAAQTDGTNEGADRFPVRVSVINIEGQAIIYESDAMFPIGDKISDLGSFYNLDSETLWYNEAFGGTAYFNTTNLEDGNTYYARIGQGLCSGLKILAITVELEDIVEPELVNCIKFVPQPGREYVISGWVREESLTPSSLGFIDFNDNLEAQEAVLGLFQTLTNRIIEDRLEIPKEFVVKTLFPELDMSSVLPFLKNFTGNNVTVYDFKFEYENVDGLLRNIGYSFSLDPGSDSRMEFRTPEVTLVFNIFPGFNPSEFPLGFHYPLRNYDNLTIEHNSVSILPGDLLRVNSNFILDIPEPSFLKDDFMGYDSDSPSDSGIGESVEIFEYLENPDYETMNYDMTYIELEYKDEGGNVIGIDEDNRFFKPKGTVIDGWQRISNVFPIPAGAAYMRINLKTDLDGINAYFDDVRMHPINSNVKSFVYDPITQRLQAELDENNYATFYEYDTEGGLVRVKKETERGVYTIQETRSGNSKLNSGQ